MLRKKRGTNPPMIPCVQEHWRGVWFSNIHKGFNLSDFQRTMKRYRLGLPYWNYLTLLDYCSSETWSALTAKYRALEINPFFFFGICPHTDFRAATVRALEDAQCRFQHNHQRGWCRKGTGLQQCRSCPTEYQADLQGWWGFGVYVTITKWLDLGEGRNWTDFKWRSHLANMERYQTGTEDMTTYLRELGFIKNAFEQNKNWAFNLFWYVR